MLQETSSPTTEHQSTMCTKALTMRQERRLVAYLDERFLELTSEYKKRSTPVTKVPTLHCYILYARRLLAFILQIPPIDPSTSLRMQYMLRLTGDVLNAIPGYTLLPQTAITGIEDVPETDGIQTESQTSAEKDEEPKDYRSLLRELLDWLDDLDQAWLAVLQSQVWNPDTREGADLEVALGTLNDNNKKESNSKKSTAITQTDVTRLRSMLISNMANLEEWLGQGKAPEAGEVDVSGMLERLGLLDEFDDLFGRTMDYLGGFGGQVFEPETLPNPVEIEMDGCS